MRGSGEDVILARRCDVCVPSMALAAHITQLAFTEAILELRACDRALSHLRHPTCHSQRQSRYRLMRGSGEDVTLARRCDVWLLSTALATHITQLALTPTILRLRACARALSQVTSFHLPLSAPVKGQVDAWEW